MSAFVMNEARKHARQLVQNYYENIDIGCGQMSFCMRGHQTQESRETISDRHWMR